MGLSTDTGATLSSDGLFVDVDDLVASFTSGAISVTTSAAEAKIGGSALAHRKLLSLLPTNGTIYFGSTSGVTTATGTPIFKNQLLTLSFTDAAHVYVIAGSTIDVRIIEGA